MSQQQRDLLFATGDVVHVAECSTSSLQPQYFASVARRPIMLILWGMSDRYGVAQQQGVEVIEASAWNTAHLYCEGFRSRAEEREDGTVATMWERPGGMQVTGVLP